MRRTRIRSVSAKRRRRDRAYQAARAAVFERAGGRCEARASFACTGRVEEVHHVAGRGGEDPHRLSNLLGVCSPCHDHIHRYPQLSYDRGWMVRRNGAADAEGEAYDGPGAA